MRDVVIIGSGVSGSALARELSKYQLNVLVLEKENDTGYGSSKANSGISHAGYDPEPGTLMAKYNVRGNQMMEALCRDLTVPFVKTGAVVVAFAKEELKTLNELLTRGLANGILPEHQKILNQKELRALEPNISEEALGAYFCSETGIVSSFELCVGMLENAVINGVEFSPNTEVTGISKTDKGFLIKTSNPKMPQVETRYLVNAAGGFADKIHNMVAPPAYTIKSRRGEYFLLSKKYGGLAKTVVFQCPSDKGKGVLVSPTAHGNLIVGPNAYFVDSPDNVDTTPEGLQEVRELAVKSIPNIPFGSNLRNFSGNRAEASTGDFIIGPVEDVPNFFEIAGIKSPGLTSSPAIAVDVVSMMEEAGLELKQKTNYNPHRLLVHLDYLSFDERARLIQANPLYGRIICRCENVSEGEILDAMRRPNGGNTIEGVKKRTRVCAGLCQGGFCMPRIVEIMAREMHCTPEQIYQDKNGSYIVTDSTGGQK
ncbi:MAG: NAD(P)/FAD-dependent oxidoreductase [Brevinema sp.]